ncbi:hypothetical protein [uncultured Rubinisphaera sp.]|uniref:WD40 repeat domain-containing protein n=1 Tax=uncultured Rubinisphaera sp. TaxID=1678686 RepID=UPI0030D9D466
MDFTKTHIEFDHKHTSPLVSCRFSQNGENVFFGAEDYKVWRWNWKEDTKIEFKTDAWVMSLAFSNDGETLITGGYDGRLMWWSSTADSPEPIRIIEGHEGWIRALTVSPDGKLLASVGNDRVIRLWNLADGTSVKEFHGQPEGSEGAIRHASYIYNVAFHPEGKSLVTGDLMGQLIEWSLDTGVPQRAWTAESLSKYDTGFRAQIGGFRSLLFDADGSKLYASGITNVSNAFAGVGNPSVVEFDWKEGKQLIEYLSKPKLQGVAWGAAVHSDGTIIGAHGGSNGNLMFWKPGEAEAAFQLKLPQNARALHLHPGEEHVAVACSDGHLRIYRLGPKA